MAGRWNAHFEDVGIGRAEAASLCADGAGDILDRVRLFIGRRDGLGLQKELARLLALAREKKEIPLLGEMLVIGKFDLFGSERSTSLRMWN